VATEVGTDVTHGRGDHWAAVAAWLGWICGGPLIPLVVLGASWSNRESLAWRHARAACVMWAVLLGVWIPAYWLAQRGRPEDDLSSGTTWLGLAMLTCLATASIVGAVVALRSD
jgi:hypothetical protein